MDKKEAEQIIAKAGPWVSAVSDQVEGGYRHVSVVHIGNKSPEEIAKLEEALKHFRHDGPNSEYSSHLSRPDSEIKQGLEFYGSTKTLGIETFVPSDAGMAKMQELHQSIKNNGGNLYEWSDDHREWTNQYPENGPKHMKIEDFKAGAVATALSATEPLKAATPAKIDFVEDLRERFGMETARDVVQTLKQNGLPLPESRAEYQMENGVFRMHSAAHGLDVEIARAPIGQGLLSSVLVSELDLDGNPVVRVNDKFTAGTAEISIRAPVVKQVVQPLPDTPFVQDIRAKFGEETARGVVSSMQDMGVELPSQKAGYAVDGGTIEVYSQKHGAAFRIERARDGDIPIPLAFEVDAKGEALIDKGAKFHAGDALVNVTDPKLTSAYAASVASATRSGPIDFVEDLKSRYDMTTVREVVLNLKKMDIPLPETRGQYSIGPDGISILAIKQGVVAKIVPQENPSASRFLYNLSDPVAANVKEGNSFSSGGALIKIESPLADSPRAAVLPGGWNLAAPAERPSMQPPSRPEISRPVPERLSDGWVLVDPAEVRKSFPSDVDLVPITPEAKKRAPDWTLEPLDGEKQLASQKRPQPAKPSAAAEGVQAKAGKATGRAEVLVNIAEGNYAGAAVVAGTQAALNEKSYSAAAKLTSTIKPVASALGQFAKRVPVIGAVVTAGYVAYEVGGHALKGDMAKAGTATLAGAAEIAGNMVGFGVGDAARESVRGTAIAIGGDQVAVEKSGLRILGERLFNLTESKFSNGKPSIQDIEARQKKLISGDPVFVQTAKVDGKEVPLLEAMRDETRNLRYQEQLKKAGGPDGKFDKQIRELDEFRKLERERKKILSSQPPRPSDPSHSGKSPQP